MNHILSNTSLLLNGKRWKYFEVSTTWTLQVGARLFEIYIEIIFSKIAPCWHKSTVWFTQVHRVRLKKILKNKIEKNIFNFIKRFWKFALKFYIKLKFLNLRLIRKKLARRQDIKICWLAFPQQTHMTRILGDWVPFASFHQDLSGMPLIYMYY